MSREISIHIDSRKCCDTEAIVSSINNKLIVFPGASITVNMTLESLANVVKRRIPSKNIGIYCGATLYHTKSIALSRSDVLIDIPYNIDFLPQHAAKLSVLFDLVKSKPQSCAKLYEVLTSHRIMGYNLSLSIRNRIPCIFKSDCDLLLDGIFQPYNDIEINNKYVKSEVEFKNSLLNSVFALNTSLNDAENHEGLELFPLSDIV